MRKMLCSFMIFYLAFSMTACAKSPMTVRTNDSSVTGNDTKSVISAEQDTKVDTKSADVDLTSLSSIMVYSEIYNMMLSPDEYIGKTIKIKGQFSTYEDEDTGNVYYSCLISDATACCLQGLEFILEEERSYPDEYPEQGSDITIIGEFQTCIENEVLYCHLEKAEIL